MKYRLFALACSVLVVAGTVVGSDPAADSPNIVGIWEGTLKAPGADLRLVFKVGQTADGQLQGTMDSLDQGANNLPLTQVKVADGKVTMELKLANGIFEGTINEAGTEIVGEWKQSGLSLPLTLRKTDKASELRRPQTPQKPYPYLEEEVVFENAPAQVKLAGTLTLPRAAGQPGGAPVPAVLLISGSGPQDRDETVFGHKPFLVLADYLTRRGYAVLRVDDRGVGKSTGEFAKATTEDFVEDVLAGVQFLKSRKEVNAKMIGLIGHSEGGLIAPLAAVRSGDVAFIVLLAGPGLPGEEILYLQGAALLKAEGADANKLRRQRETQEKLFAAVKSETDPAALDKKLRDAVDEVLALYADAEPKEREMIEKTLNAQLPFLKSPWLRFFLTHDPRPVLKAVQCPVLAIIGEKDLQVPPRENLAEIEQAMKDGGNQTHIVRELPGLNHLFQTCTTGAVSEYAKIEETFAPAALELIGDWLDQTIRGK